MIYALRKLIAFVFLGGIFWFVVPVVVVKCRVRRRVRQNRARFSDWLARNEGRPIEPQRRENPKLSLEEGERVYYHEKGTLYVEKGAGFDEISVPGKPGDVAFPGKRRLNRKIQRTHFYMTNHRVAFEGKDRRLLFVGKALDFGVRQGELEDVKVEPGALSFKVRRGGRDVCVATTFQNPLVVAHILESVRTHSSRSATQGKESC